MLLRAKFWLQLVTELKNRGVTDIFIACVDGLKGFPDAIAVEYPQTKVQLCIVHMVRNSLRYAHNGTAAKAACVSALRQRAASAEWRSCFTVILVVAADAGNGRQVQGKTAWSLAPCVGPPSQCFQADS